MEITTLLSRCLFGTLFLLSSSFPSLYFSLSTPELSSQLLSRRLLKSAPRNTIQQYLTPHNTIRAKLGLPPLQWSKKLANYASWWAHQRQGDCALIHSNSNYGENLFWGSGKDWKPADAVEAWAAERSYYNPETNSCTQNRDCLHYTQIIWRQSSKVGCAKVLCRSPLDTLIICNYDPHGNVIGQRPL
ncbi:Pathogenesis-related protein PR-1 [Morella rubra]|uniref:Pathogenesis-related protein PR-1 n=1 Tax=Morella rubra TaxID=262757 RepID=A0A6A1UYK1_9ROSI|nr:Pathogenesis-related protein PR-1 [Morella rubra]